MSLVQVRRSASRPLVVEDPAGVQVVEVADELFAVKLRQGRLLSGSKATSTGGFTCNKGTLPRPAMSSIVKGFL